jgi:quinol monooxygenase YgiN
MLIVAGTITIEPGKRDDFLQARESSIKATRSEPGCLEYGFAADSLESDVVRVFERWETQEALNTHLGVLASAQPESGAPAIKVVGADILQYDIASSGPLGGR